MEVTTLIVLSIGIIMFALLAFLLEIDLVITAAIGGALASAFWLIHVVKLGIMGRVYEFLAAFTWFVFSLVVFLYESVK